MASVSGPIPIAPVSSSSSTQVPLRRLSAPPSTPWEVAATTGNPVWHRPQSRHPALQPAQPQIRGGIRPQAGVLHETLRQRGLVQSSAASSVEHVTLTSQPLRQRRQLHPQTCVRSGLHTTSTVPSSSVGAVPSPVVSVLATASLPGFSSTSLPTSPTTMVVDAMPQWPTQARRPVETLAAPTSPAYVGSARSCGSCASVERRSTVGAGALCDVTSGAPAASPSLRSEGMVRPVQATGDETVIVAVSSSNEGRHRDDAGSGEGGEIGADIATAASSFVARRVSREDVGVQSSVASSSRLAASAPASTRAGVVARSGRGARAPAFSPPPRPDAGAALSQDLTGDGASSDSSGPAASRGRTISSRGVGSHSSGATARRLRLAPRSVGPTDAVPASRSPVARQHRPGHAANGASAAVSVRAARQPVAAQDQRHREQRRALGQQVAAALHEHKQQLQMQKQAHLQRHMAAQIQQLMGRSLPSPNDELAAVVVSIHNDVCSPGTGGSSCDVVADSGSHNVVSDATLTKGKRDEIPRRSCVGIRRQPRRGHERRTYIAEYEVNVRLLPRLITALCDNVGAGDDASDMDGECADGEDGDEHEEELFSQLLALMVDMEAVEPQCVAFELEGSAARLPHEGVAASSSSSKAPAIVDLAGLLISRGHMVSFSDGALHAFIQAWNEPHEILGDNPFSSLGECSGNATIRFDSRQLMISASARLRAVGELCKEGRAQVRAPGSSIAAFTLAVGGNESTELGAAAPELSEVEEADEIDVPYEIDVLTVATDLPGIDFSDLPRICKAGGLRGAAAGHVLLRYHATGGALLACAGRWQHAEGGLTLGSNAKIRGLEEALLKVVGASNGQDVAMAVQQRLACCGTMSEARTELVQRLATQYIQQSVPCAYHCVVYQTQLSED